jgi:hypothetical protein
LTSKTITRTKSDPWRDFICAFELPLERAAVQSPLSGILTSFNAVDLELDNFLGSHPAVVHAKTWQSVWRTKTELTSAIGAYEWSARQHGSSVREEIYALSNATKNWLDQVFRHLEMIKKIHNALSTDQSLRKRKKADVSTQLAPLCEPLSRCISKLKHDAAEVCPMHYSSDESGVVSGFYVGVNHGASAFGPHPHIHPNRGAWSFNRLLPLVGCGIFWAERLISASILRERRTISLSDPRDAVQFLDEQSLRGDADRPLFVFPDERSIPFPRIEFLNHSVKFAVGTLSTQRPKFPAAARIESVLSLTSAYKGDTFELPYWQIHN